MYQPQSHYPPPASAAGSAIPVGSAPIASMMQTQVAPLPSAPNVVHHHPYGNGQVAGGGGGMGVRSGARSMPTGNGYLNGATLPEYGGMATSLTSNQTQPQPTQYSQRHNSNLGSSDSSTISLNRQQLPPQQQQQPQQQSNQHQQNNQADSSSNGPSVAPRQHQHYINLLNEKTLVPFTVKAYRLDSKDAQDMVELTINSEVYFDRGAFGTVFRARLISEDARVVAVKTVIQDKRYRNRELPLMKNLSHPNIVTLFYFYFSVKIDNREEKCLNLVMEFLPKNVSHLIPRRAKRDLDRHAIPTTPFTIKILMYQIFRALSYIHTNGICHRDIKPNNLLFNPETGELKVCDFGSAKQLNPGERNVSYICARYYRAPELLFGATDYTNMIDLWSTGIVWSELLLGYPMFHENSGVDQLVNIISKLGTPSKEEIQAMNKAYLKYNLPQLPRIPLSQLLPRTTQREGMDLIHQLFQYDPRKRIAPLLACAHPYFDELREPGKKWVNGRDLPDLFNFTDFEMSSNPGLRSQLMPRTTASTPVPAQQQQPPGSQKSSIPIAIKPTYNPYHDDPYC